MVNDKSKSFFKHNIFLIKVLANAALILENKGNQLKQNKTKQNSFDHCLDLTIFYLNPIADDEND